MVSRKSNSHRTNRKTKDYPRLNSNIKTSPIFLMLFFIFIVFAVGASTYGDLIMFKFLKTYSITLKNIIHFVLFIIIGYIYPEYLAEASVFGIIIEISEDLLEKKCENNECKEELVCGLKWKYSSTNLIMNLFGLIIGQYISKIKLSNVASS